MIAIAGIGIGGLLGPGSNRPTPTPGSTPVATSDRWFLTLPGLEMTPTRADLGAATAVLVGRLQALGIQPIVEGGDPGIAVRVPPGGATDAAIRMVLGAVGHVAFVPLPPGDYGEFGDGRFKAVVGEPLPTDPPALFGWDGIESIDLADPEDAAVDGAPHLVFALNDRGQATFAQWSQSHVGETIAILVDGRVALLATVNEPIPGGSSPSRPGSSPEIASRRRPPSWWVAGSPRRSASASSRTFNSRNRQKATHGLWKPC